MGTVLEGLPNNALVGGLLVAAGILLRRSVEDASTAHPAPPVDAFALCLRAGHRESPHQLGRLPVGQVGSDASGAGLVGQRDEAGTFRVIYTARLADAVYVLHAFQKKTQTTSKRDIDLAKARFAELTRGDR